MSINTTILNEISAIFPPIFLPIYSKLYQSNTNWPANNATTRYFAKEEKNNLIIGQQWRLAQSSNYRHVGRWATLISSSSENWETGLSSLKKKLVKPAVKWPWACDEDLFDALLHDNDTRNCAKNHHLCLIMYVCTSAPTLFLSINSWCLDRESAQKKKIRFLLFSRVFSILFFKFFWIVANSKKSRQYIAIWVFSSSPTWNDFHEIFREIDFTRKTRLLFFKFKT